MLDNPQNIPTILIGIASVIIPFYIFFIYVFRKTKKVKAKIIATEAYPIYNHSRFDPRKVIMKYTVTFMAEGKKLSFFVDEYSYGAYKKNQKGLLIYKGPKLIEFRQ